ncbi:MAG: COX15/CtaA family protein [Flavobacteriales bacterium]|nr:COX15/CtaA family protein [Flavobacteriales bacterium]
MNRLESLIRRLAWVSLIFVYLVIVAGSVVRMTGSGMGCPDWPKCFGYAIPPTSVDDVTWESGRQYNKGQMIVHEFFNGEIYEDRMLTAKEDFTAGADYNSANWELYDKHDYAIFNPIHTWIEFINRLIGALTGIPVLALFAASLLFAIRHKKWAYFFLAGGVLFMLGFEAWLGKLVVDGNLIPGSITIHMLGSIVLFVLLLFIIRRGQVRRFTLARNVSLLLVAGMIITLAQILLGTQVREEVDHLVHAGVMDRSLWIENLENPTTYLIHRSFSWVVLIVIGAWYYLQQKATQVVPEMHLALGLLLLQLIVGITLAYGGMPASLQPVHLVAGMIMLGALWSALLRGMGKATSA